MCQPLRLLMNPVLVLLLLLLLCLQLFAAPAVGKLLAVAAVALPIIAVGGLAYRKAVGDPDCSWQEALGRTYCVLNNCPGELDESLHLKLVLNTI
jgi:hypothetical protein